jgi:hypothetical protein
MVWLYTNTGNSVFTKTYQQNILWTKVLYCWMQISQWHRRGPMISVPSNTHLASIFAWKIRTNEVNRPAKWWTVCLWPVCGWGPWDWKFRAQGVEADFMILTPFLHFLRYSFWILAKSLLRNSPGLRYLLENDHLSQERWCSTGLPKFGEWGTGCNTKLSKSELNLQYLQNAKLC